MFRPLVLMLSLVATLLFPGSWAANHNDTLPQPAERSSPMLTSCYPGICKAWNQWNGGAIGGYADIDQWFDYCNIGCDYVEKGTWAKRSSDGTYIALVIQKAYGGVPT